MTPALHARLQALREECLACSTGLTDGEYRSSYHPELSPLGWHLGHVLFVEAHWLAEQIFGDTRHTARWRDLFLPEYSPKPGRGQRLPLLQDLLMAWPALSAGCDVLWHRVMAGGRRHPLLERDYLAWFLIQHYAQHLETLRMVLQQRQLKQQSPQPLPPPLQSSAAAACPGMAIAAHELRLGADDPVTAYDNEMPPMQLGVPAFRIATRPVSNAQWLGFMRAGGYESPRWWPGESASWLVQTACTHPQHWRRHPAGGWYALDADGPGVLQPDAPVDGIGWHEAQAYTLWAGARLPHEYEWESATRQGLLADTGHCWEWCANPLHAYPGYRAYPYDGYSQPWFDGRHYVLRGGSRHTQPELRRPSFRNFYPPSHRHVFGGLRLAW